jgi:hypothetical protein
MSCPTVKIKDSKDSYIVINKSDYDIKLHKLYQEDKPATKKITKKAAK